MPVAKMAYSDRNREGVNLNAHAREIKSPVKLRGGERGRIDLGSANQVR